MPKLIIDDSLIAYADGSEQSLLDLYSTNTDDDINEDLYINNWPIYYHVSKSRQNIINWVDFGTHKLDILELGAGCGAVTKALVETGNNITTVEGSLERAKVIQQRFKTDDNLTIHACEITSFDDKKKYDVVTLIGVLEYAGAYIKSKTPFEDMLNKAKSFLKDDGCLIIAIENQLGHKYLAGIPEDHYAKSYEGINGYPSYNGIRTFDKATLSDLLKNQGLINQKWCYPFPDYKMPQVVLSDLAFDEKFDFKALLDLPTKDLSFNTTAVFNENTFLKLLDLNNTVKIFMNSFLVFVSTQEDNKIINYNSNKVAVKASVAGRAKPFQARTEFIRNTNGISVIKKPVNKTLTSGNEAIIFDPISDNVEYTSDGNNLAEMIIDAVIANKYDQAAGYLKIWHDYLMSRCISEPNNCDKEFDDFSKSYVGINLYPSEKNECYLASKYFDAHPGNILIKEDGSFIRIDKEWTVKTNIPAKLVFERSLLVLGHRLNKLSTYLSSDIDSESGLPIQLLELVKEFKLSESIDFANCRRFEKWIQNIISTNKIVSLIEIEGIERLQKEQAINEQIASDNKVKAFIRPMRKVLRRIFNKLADISFPFD